MLIDREQGGQKELAAKGYQLHSAITISQILDALKETQAIPLAQYNEIKSYFSNPEKWSEGK